MDKSFEKLTQELDKIEEVNMNKPIISFDIEIYNELPEDGEVNYSEIIPSVAAFTVDGETVEYFYDLPYMTVETGRKMINQMMEYGRNGFSVYAWNGVSFDLRVMGLYTGMIDECSMLALTSIDTMLSLVFRKGFWLGLDKALIGAGLESKTHTVKLNNGSLMFDMDGSKAPQMWRDGEIDAVKQYLSGDVIQPYKLARDIEVRNRIDWTSNAGKPSFCKGISLEPVWSLFYKKLPDPKRLTWLTDRPLRSQFVDWIPQDIFDKFVPDKSEWGAPRYID